MIIRGNYSPLYQIKELIMEKIEKVKIKTFEDFKEQLKKVKETQSEIVLSYMA